MANAISITISATDRATAVIDRVNKGFEDFNRRVAVVSAAGDRFGKSVAKLGDVSGVNRIATGIGDIGRRVVGATESLGRFAPALGGIAGAASIAGLAKLAEIWSGFSARLGLDASRINTSASTLHGLQGAARLAGSSAEALTDGMRTLGDNLVDAVGGRSPETVVMLRTLGIGFRDASTGGARLAEDVLPEIADKIKGLRTPALQAMVATRLFGGAGEALLPFLRRGAAGIAEYNEQAKRYGVQNEAGVRAAMDFREAQTRVGLAVEGVAYAVSERLAPVLVPLLTRFADWIASHRGDIAAFFADVAARLDAWSTNGGPMRLVEGLETVGGKIKAVIDFMGGWENAAILVAGVMNAQVIASVLAVVGAVAKLTFAVGTQLVAAVGLAETAMSTFNTRTMTLPVFRVLGLTLGVIDRIGQGIPVNQMTPEMRERFGLNAPETVPGTVPGSSSGDGAPSWWQRNMPTWLGGHPAAGAGGGAVGNTAPPPLPQGEQATRARTAFDAFRGMGDSEEVAAARVANIQVESRFDERAVGDNGQAYGLGQHHPDRQRQFAEMFHRDIRGSSFDEQLRFLHDDPDAQSRINNEAMRARPPATAFDAAGLITRFQERPGDIAGESYRRGVLATRLLQRFRAERETASRAAQPTAPATGLPAAPTSARLDAAPPPPPMAPPVPLPPAPAAGQPGPNGRVGVDISFQNQPPGLRMTTSTEGGVTVRAPRIETAMPGWALP